MLQYTLSNILAVKTVYSVAPRAGQRWTLDSRTDSQCTMVGAKMEYADAGVALMNIAGAKEDKTFGYPCIDIMERKINLLMRSQRLLAIGRMPLYLPYISKFGSKCLR